MGSGLYANPEAVAWLEGAPAHIQNEDSWEYWEMEGMRPPQPVTTHDLVEETDVMGDGERLSQPWTLEAAVAAIPRWTVDVGQSFRWDPNRKSGHLIVSSGFEIMPSWPAGWDFSYSEEWNRAHATTEPVLAGSSAV